MYRLLFILYMEAREELGYAPMKSDAYRLGYSFDSLRDLEVVELTTEESRQGFYIHDSIKLLFDLIYRGYPEYEAAKDNQPLLLTLPPSSRTRSAENVQTYGFDLFPLRSHLFDPAKTPLLNKVRLRNSEMLQILKLMSLSKSKGGKQRSGRISYAQLGINQLGALSMRPCSASTASLQNKIFSRFSLLRRKTQKLMRNMMTIRISMIRVRTSDHRLKEARARQRVRHTRDELEIAYLVPLEELEKYTMFERVFDQDGSKKNTKKGVASFTV